MITESDDIINNNDTDASDSSLPVTLQFKKQNNKY